MWQEPTQPGQGGDDASPPLRNRGGRALRTLPRVDRPREKLAARGPQALSTRELLAMLLGSGVRGRNVLEVAGELLKLAGERQLPHLSLTELTRVPGIGSARASLLVAAFELGRRCFIPEETEPTFQSSADVYRHCRSLSAARKEHFVCLYLNAKNQLIREETVAIGGLFANLIHPREVFAPAVEASAAAVILIHNHPSGDPEPSPEDLSLTRRLIEAGVLLGIDVLDHLIVGKRSFVSLQERGAFK